MSRKVKKPWGSELIWAETNKYAGKILTIRGGHKLSRQYHVKKEETIFVLYGILIVEEGKDDNIIKHTLTKGQTFHVKPGMVHRFCANFGDVDIIEVSTPELDDVVRIEDDYSRN